MQTNWFTQLDVRSPPNGLAAWAWRHDDALRAWKTCTRADWLLWMLALCHADRATLTLAAAACAETVLPAVLAGDPRPARAIEAARAWARREIDGIELQRARLEAVASAGAAATALGGAIDANDRAATTAAMAAARAAAMAADVGRRPHSAHCAAAQAARAVGGSSRYEPHLARCAEIVRDLRWPASAPPRLQSCRPALQVAWDLVSEQAVPVTLSTAELLGARIFRATLARELGRPNAYEQRLLDHLVERVVTVPDPQELQDEIVKLIQRRKKAA